MESSLECGVCFSEYNSNEHRPKSLPCGHTICSSCIRDNLISRDGKMNCPFCRSPCGTGIKTLDDFPTTFALLNLLDTTGQKGTAKILSPKEKEKETIQQKKQAEHNRTAAHIADCNKHLLNLQHAKETQESAMQSIKREQRKLQEEEKRVASITQQLDDIVDEGNDIVKGLEGVQDRFKSASSLFGLNMASKDMQNYYTASQEWVTSRVMSILKEDVHLAREIQFSPLTIESLKERVTASNVEVWASIMMRNQTYSAQLSMTQGHLLLRSLSKKAPPANTLTIPYQNVKCLVERNNVKTFMELNLSRWYLQRSNIGNRLIHIKLMGDEGRTQQFELMCTGEVDGISYANTTFLDLENPPLSGIWGGARNDGLDTALPGYVSGNKIKERIVRGLVAGFYHSTPKRKPTHFVIYTDGHPEYIEDTVIGKVVLGLNDIQCVYSQAKLHGARNIKIEDCGIVLD